MNNNMSDAAKQAQEEAEIKVTDACKIKGLNTISYEYDRYYQDMIVLCHTIYHSVENGKILIKSKINLIINNIFTSPLESYF